MVQIHSLRQPLLNQQFTGIRMLVVRLILCIKCEVCSVASLSPNLRPDGFARPFERFGNIWQQLTTERLVTPWLGET